MWAAGERDGVDGRGTGETALLCCRVGGKRSSRAGLGGGLALRPGRAANAVAEEGRVSGTGSGPPWGIQRMEGVAAVRGACIPVIAAMMGDTSDCDAVCSSSVRGRKTDRQTHTHTHTHTAREREREREYAFA